MNQQDQNFSSSLSFFSGGGWVYWLTEKRGFIALLLPLLLVGSFILFRTTTKKGSEADYVAAEVAFKQWEKATDALNSSFDSLQAMMKKHPELAGRYDGAIVQRLIAKNQFDHALLTAMRTIERSSDLAPYWADFGGTTLLIGKHEYKKALAEAERLKEEMLSDERFFVENECVYGGMLFGLNLMRIAFLQQKLENPSEELMAWKQFKRFGGLENEAPQEQKKAVQQLISHFTAQNISLLDYIRHREEKCGRLLG